MCFVNIFFNLTLRGHTWCKKVQPEAFTGILGDEVADAARCDQQDLSAMHCMRESLISERTGLVNQHWPGRMGALGDVAGREAVADPSRHSLRS